MGVQITDRRTDDGTDYQTRDILDKDWCYHCGPQGSPEGHSREFCRKCGGKCGTTRRQYRREKGAPWHWTLDADLGSNITRLRAVDDGIIATTEDGRQHHIGEDILLAGIPPTTD